jgi:hypothetical protein
MSSAEKQQEFLENGRFGEGEQSLARTKVSNCFGAAWSFWPWLAPFSGLLLFSKSAGTMEVRSF